MYCENCGKPAQAGDKFCESCGARLEIPASSPLNTLPPAMQSDSLQPSDMKVLPRKPLSKKAKIGISAVGGTILLLAAAFMILRMTYGPSTPEDLAKQLNASIDSQNADELSKYLDDPASPLLAADRIDVFKAALKNEAVRKTYKAGILNAISAAETQAKQPARKNTFSDKLRAELEEDSDQLPDSWMTFVKKTSWRGSKWSVQIMPVTLNAQASDSEDTLHSSIKVGALTGNDQIGIQNLWPATYAYTGTLSGEYGSQAYQGSIDAYDYYNPSTAILDTSELNAITLHFPPFEASVTLNGKAIQGTPGDSALFRPVPKDVEVAVSANAYGVELSGKTKLNTAEESSFDLQELLRAPAAEKAADLTYAAFDSWVKATHSGNAALLKGYNPEGSFAGYMTWDLENESSEQYALKQIQLAPSSVYFESDALSVDIAASYVSSAAPDEVKTDMLNLRFTQQPDKKDWWIDGYSSTSMADDESNLTRSNTGFEAEAAKLSTAAGTAGQSAGQVSASGTAAFSQDDAQAFMRNYVSSSVDAINQRNFSIVAGLMDPSGSAYKESSDYIGYLDKKGITEEFVDAVVTGLENNGDSTYTVHTTESYVIYNKDYEGTNRTFNSVYKLSTVDGQLRAHTLISTKEVK